MQKLPEYAVSHIQLQFSYSQQTTKTQEENVSHSARIKHVQYFSRESATHKNAY